MVKRKVQLVYGPASGRDVEVELNQTCYSVPIINTAVLWTDRPPEPTAEINYQMVVYRPKFEGAKQWYPDNEEHYYLGDIWDGHRPTERQQGPSRSLAGGSERRESERGQGEL